MLYEYECKKCGKRLKREKEEGKELNYFEICPNCSGDMLLTDWEILKLIRGEESKKTDFQSDLFPNF